MYIEHHLKKFYNSLLSRGCTDEHINYYNLQNEKEKENETKSYKRANM